MGKHIILLIILVGTTFSTWAEGLKKETYLYAVKDADSLYLDHYRAPVTGDRPCMIFMFGGGFAAGERNNKFYTPYFDFLTQQGFDVVSIDYRLGLKNIRNVGQDLSMRNVIGMLNNAVNIAVEDLFSATLFILDNAEKWHIDPSNIVTSGSSAGAISVLQAEHNICNRTSRAAVLPSDFNYAGVVSFAGALFSIDGNPEWLNQPAPIMMFHGNADQQVPYHKATMLRVGFFGSKFLAEEFSKKGWSHWFYSIDNDTHDVAGSPMYDNYNEIATFLKNFVLARRPLSITTEERDAELPVRKKKFKVIDYIEANYGK